MLQAERQRREREELERKNLALATAKGLKRRIAAGDAVYLHESIYLPVDSRVVDEEVCRRFSIEPLSRLGIEGWEVVGIVPRTVGVGLTNRSVGSTMGESWGAGVGGNVVGVHVLLRLKATPSNCSDRMLFDYAMRHLDALAVAEE
jgi:hypothetical protein